MVFPSALPNGIELEDEFILQRFEVAQPANNRAKKPAIRIDAKLNEFFLMVALVGRVSFFRFVHMWRMNQFYENNVWWARQIAWALVSD